MNSWSGTSCGSARDVTAPDTDMARDRDAAADYYQKTSDMGDAAARLFVCLFIIIITLSKQLSYLGFS